ncbi:MAG: Nif3-like dinuclear metal center hexameric protein, partial [Mailhella sp.]|nr:Nif3-like dinuclear metal center hexameric protein [Mailhella sp.]
QGASARSEIRRLAVCLDPAPEQIRLAAAHGADMVLTHHPLALEPQWTDALNGHTDCLRVLYSRDMPLYSCHTTLDANPLGPSAWLPDEFHLGNRTILEPCGTFVNEHGEVLPGGFGCAGDLPEPMTAAEFCRALSAFLPLGRMCGTARLIGSPDAVIRRVAVCTGSGSSLIEDALRAGADLYITGDVKYHDALPLYSRHDPASSDHSRTAVLDVGHFSLEEEMMRRFALMLEAQLEGVAVEFLPGTDPFLPITFLSEVPEVLS